MVNIFIDDIKIIAPKKSRITQYMKVELTSTFSIVDINSINFYFDSKIE